MRLEAVHDRPKDRDRMSCDRAARRAQTARTTARAHHVHRDVRGLYMALRAVVHRSLATARPSQEVLLPARLTSHNDDSRVYSAGLRNPAQSPNPALTRHRNMKRHRTLQRRAGLPGLIPPYLYIEKTCTRKLMYIAHIEVAGKKPGYPG